MKKKRPAPKKTLAAAAGQAAPISPTYTVSFRWLSQGQVQTRSFITTDSELYSQTCYWSFVIANRRRLNAKAWDDLRDLGANEIRKLAKEVIDPAGLLQISQAGIVEVSIPYQTESVGWAARVFPWEDVLTLITRKDRENRPLLVLRHLACQHQPPERPAQKMLLVASAPGAVAELYSFSGECQMVRGALGIEPDQAGPRMDQMLLTPSAEELQKAAQDFDPDIIHLAGMDVHQGEMILDDLPPPDADPTDGFLLKGDAATYQVATPIQLGNIVNAGKAKPLLVAVNCFYSGPRLAAMSVAGGARHAIGFQDTMDDAFAEQFFGDFYSVWRQNGWADILQAFRAALERQRTRPGSSAISGVTLWSSVSLLAPKPVSKPKPTLEQPKVASTWTDAKLRLALSADVVPCDKLNYSMLHNNKDLFDRFMIRNNTNHSLPPIELEVTLHVGATDFPYRALFDMDSDGKERTLNVAKLVRVPLVANLLRECRESIVSSLRVEIHCADTCIFLRTFPVSLLSADEWRDTDLDRRWLPSFVFPRDPIVPKLMSQANRYLRAIADDTTAGFDGYLQLGPQGEDPNDTVATQVRALWSMLTNEYSVRYITPPPTYTRASQRLRPPSLVMDSCNGTCIDLSLLFAACLEYVGIYPVVFLITGHAFPGFWRSDQARQNWMTSTVGLQNADQQPNLQSSSLMGSDSTDSEPWMFKRKTQLETIVRCVQNGDLMPFESTLLTAPESFAKALEAGAQNLSLQTFECMIDVQLAREQQITPLPISLTRQ
jgi:hypothetical protein